MGPRHSLALGGPGAHQADEVAIAEGDVRLLQALARVVVEPCTPAAAAADLEAARAAISSWAAVERLLRVHRAGALAYTVLTVPEVRSAVDPPADLIDRLRRTYMTAFSWMVAEPPRIARCLAALAESGVPALAIKGVVVGAWLYDDPAVREHVDIDLLVPESQAATVDRVLGELGYIQASGPYDAPEPYRGPPLHPDESLATVAYRSTVGQPPIDLSYDPLRHFWRPRGNEPEPFGDWWGRRQTIEIGDVTLPTLGADDQLLQLARHLQFHDYSRLIWFVDLLLLLRRFGDELDWSRVGDEARRWDIAGGIYRTLELADAIYGVRAPDAAWRALRPSPPSRLLHRVVWPTAEAEPRDRRQGQGNPLTPRMVAPRGGRQWAGLTLLLGDRHRRRALAFLVRRAFPPRSWLTANYGSQSGAGGYLGLWRHHRRTLRRQRDGSKHE